MQKFAATLVLGLVSAVAVATAAAADPAQTEHNNAHRMVVTFLEGEGSVVPCVGEGELTLTFNGHQRLTTNDNAFHEGTMFTGTFVARLPDGTSAGRATLMSTGNYTAKKGSFTEIFTGQLTSGATSTGTPCAASDMEECSDGVSASGLTP